MGSPGTDTDPLRERLTAANLYLVTSSEPGGPRPGGLSGFLVRVLEAGVDVVQLREKEMEAAPLLRACEVVRHRTEEFGALFVVNDRVDVAVAAGADGVHLGQDDLPPPEARRQMGPEPLIGISTHAPDEVLAAGTYADYIGVGPVHPTPTKPGRSPVGYQLVSFAADHSVVPFFAIGGIDPSNIDEALAAGATRVSVARAITDAEDPAAVARQLKAVLP